MTTPGELLSRLRARGVQLRLEGDDIRVAGALTPALLDELRQRKPELVAALRAAGEGIPRLPDADAYELSHAQRRLWLLSQLDGASAAYNIPLAVRLEGDLDAGALQRALAAIVDRHESLRTAFISRDGHPLQVIDDRCSFELPVIDVASEEEARRRGTVLASQPFDLSRAPLLRCELLRLSPSRYELHLVLHHIVADGWSLGVILREVQIAYAALRKGSPPPLEPLRIHYRDFAAWQNEQLLGAEASADAEYWRGRLAGPLPVLDLPTDLARPALPSFEGDLLTFTIERGRRDALSRLARERGATLFMVLTALVKVLLHRYTGQEDLIVGTPVAGRTHADLDEQVGFYLNTLVLRDRVAASMTFAELLTQVRETSLEAYEHQLHPFDKLVEDLGAGRDMTRAPLFDVLVILQNAGTLDLALEGVTATPLQLDTDSSKVDLTFDFVDGREGLTAGIRYATDLFTRSRIERMSGHLRTLIDSVLRDPNTTIAALDILLPEEHPGVVWASGLPPASFLDLFHLQSTLTPTAPAVTFEDQTLTYRELRERATHIAAHIHDAAGPGALIGLLVERSINTLPALLGILEAGCAYVPLDPANPPRRLAHMLRDAAPPLLLTEQALAGRAEGTASHILLLDEILRTPAPPFDPPPITPTSLAYILYTSGSTGVPKGVEIEHGGLTNELLAFREHPGLAPSDTLLAVATISFDIAGLDLYLPLITGAHVVVASSELATDGIRLAERLRRGDITVLQATPGTWRMLLSAGWEGSPRLKILCGGEMLTRELAMALAARCGSLWNLYGPTETTIWTTVYDVAASLPPFHCPRAIPVGTAIPNTAVHVLDPRLRPVPIGVTGEVCIVGVGVGRGYHNLPELTAERFVANPFGEGRLYRTGDSGRLLDDGTLEILGRLDQQVKVRGFRVEIGEIESALLEHSEVRDAVVTVRSDDAGEASLAAYIIPRDTSIDAAALREHLAQRLPAYMIPSAFVPLDALPLAPTGKVDRAALPAPEMLAPPPRALPDDDVERVVAEVWADVLQLPALASDDDFFDRGGHSLKATRALFRLQRELRVPLSLSDLFRNPTVGAFAAMAKTRAVAVPIAAPTADEWEILNDR